MASIQEQALRSGLAFLGCDDDDDVPQWSTTEWPPMLDGQRSGHASVVVDHDKDQQTVVVTGGYKVDECGDSIAKSSVLLFAVGTGQKKWKEGPSLNFSRMNHAAVVCNGSVYIIGGGDEFKQRIVIEKIDVIDLTRDENAQWIEATHTLSSNQRYGCAAAVVNNRYIVVAGGMGNPRNRNTVLSSVEIIDTIVESFCAVISGPSMNVARKSFGMAVIGRRIYAIGGDDGANDLDSVEYLELNGIHEKEHENTRSIFRLSLKWKKDDDLALSFGTSKHCVVSMGQWMIVGGGEGKDRSAVEIFNTKSNASWYLPTLVEERVGSCMVVTTNGIVVIGGTRSGSCESLPLVSMKHYLTVRLHIM